MKILAVLLVLSVKWQHHLFLTMTLVAFKQLVLKELMVFLVDPFHVLQVQVQKVTQNQLIAVLRPVLLIQMLQKMLDAAIKQHVLK